MKNLADQAGGEAPKPTCPETASLNEIRLAVGNEQLLLLYNRREQLGSSIDSWTDLAERIRRRWPNWIVLKQLIDHATGIQGTEVIFAQVKTIEQQHHLLEEPDPVAPLVANLTQLLRDELNYLDNEYTSQHEVRHEASGGRHQLAADSNQSNATNYYRTKN